MSDKPKQAITIDESLIGIDSRYFSVPGNPFAKQRPRAARSGKFITIYTPRETKEYEKKVRKCYEEIYKNSKPFSKSITVEIEGIFGIPKSIPAKKANYILENNIPHTSKPDCDNMAKVCLDALNGVAYTDDSIINVLNIKKHYGENAKVNIIIKENREDTI